MKLTPSKINSNSSNFKTMSNINTQLNVKIFNKMSNLLEKITDYDLNNLTRVV